MDNDARCVPSEAIPPILPGDIIAVYSAHESAWGKPAQTYCVRRVDPDGTPVSDMDHRHSLQNVVSISRKEGNDYTEIWHKENYETAPWGQAMLQAIAIELPEETKEDIATCFSDCRKIWNNFCEENKEALGALLAPYLTLKFAEMAAKVVKEGAK